MQLLNIIDIAITCSIFVLSYSFIANRRSENQFLEVQYPILLGEPGKNAITSVIKNNKVFLIFLPIVISAITIVYTNYNMRHYYSFLNKESGLFNIQNGFGFEALDSFLISLYFNASHYIENVYSYASFYNNFILLSSIILLLYVIKNRVIFNKRIIFLVSSVFIMQFLLFIFVLLVFVDYEISHKIRLLLVIIEIIVNSYNKSIIIGIIIRLLISSFKSNDISFHLNMNLSILKNGRIYIVLLVNNIVKFHDIILTKNIGDSILIQYENTFFILKLLLSIVSPILLIRLIMYNQYLIDELKSTLLFIRENLRKIIKYLSIIFMVSFCIDNISKLIIKSESLFILTSLNLFKFILIFSMTFLISICYTYIIYFVSEKELYSP